MSIARVYIEKAISKGPLVSLVTKEVVSDFGIYCKNIPFKMFGDVKEPYSNDWIDEDGEEEYLPAGGLKWKSYEIEVEWAYKGDVNTANKKILDFINYLSGRSDGQPSMSIYCTHTGIGRTNVRLVKVADKATLVRDENNGDIVLFTTTLKVCDPVTSYTPIMPAGTPNATNE